MSTIVKEGPKTSTHAHRLLFAWGRHAIIPFSADAPFLLTAFDQPLTERLQILKLSTHRREGNRPSRPSPGYYYLRHWKAALAAKNVTRICACASSLVHIAERVIQVTLSSRCVGRALHSFYGAHTAHPSYKVILGLLCEKNKQAPVARAQNR